MEDSVTPNPTGTLRDTRTVAVVSAPVGGRARVSKVERVVGPVPADPGGRVGACVPHGRDVRPAGKVQHKSLREAHSGWPLACQTHPFQRVQFGSG